MMDDRIPKKIYKASLTRRRKQRRPRNRRKDEVEKNVRSMEIQGRKEVAKDRKKWKRIVVRQAKVHTELWSWRKKKNIELLKKPAF